MCSSAFLTNIRNSTLYQGFFKTFSFADAPQCVQSGSSELKAQRLASFGNSACDVVGAVVVHYLIAFETFVVKSVPCTAHQADPCALLLFGKHSD